jgi:hypothetical protein
MFFQRTMAWVSRAGSHRPNLFAIVSSRHRSRSAADDDHSLAGVAQVFGPFLRMNDAAGESLHPGPAGQIAFRVFVVARAQKEKVARQPQRLAALSPHVQRPARVLRAPGRSNDLVAEADPSIDAVFLRSFGEITQN